MLAPPGRTKPSASARHAIVLAVPITMHVPCVGISRPRARSRRASSISPARRAAQSRRQSVHAPSRSPSSWPASIGPTGATIAGTSALTAPMICAGIVLSQPPTSTTASSGSARNISSVSIASRFRRMQARRVRERLMQRDRRKRERQAARHRHAALNRGDERGCGGVARIEVARGGGDADHRSIERFARESGRFEKRLAQEPRERLVAIARQSPGKTAGCVGR